VRSGYCQDPTESSYTSHRTYLSIPGSDPLQGLIKPQWELFASGSDGVADWRQSYCDHVAYRMQCDAADRAGDSRPTDLPATFHGDRFFASNYCDTLESRVAGRSARSDLRDIARDMVATVDGHLELRSLRGKYLPGRGLQQLRARIIQQAAAQGHSGVAIASFFQMSPGRVSVLSRRRPKATGI
jgi:hypothetical protein